MTGRMYSHGLRHKIVKRNPLSLLGVFSFDTMRIVIIEELFELET